MARTGAPDEQQRERSDVWANKSPGAVPAPVLPVETVGLEEATSWTPKLDLTVLVVGGSIAGCCTALALRELGAKVHVFEKTSGELQSQGAGLNIQPDMLQFLQHFGICSGLEDLCLRSAGRQYVDRSGKVLAAEDRAQWFTGWDCLYRALRERVEGVDFHSGSEVGGIELAGNKAALTLADGRIFEGDLLVGADGAGSTVRQLLCPSSRSTYTRYVAWRGVLPESLAPPAALQFLANRFTLYQGYNYHLLAYMIPGANGETEAGKRRINWVWYWNTPLSEHDRILTDKTGVRQLHSVRRGMLRDDVAELRKAIAKEVLPKQLAALVGATPDIFVNTVNDLLAPSLVFGGRAVLVGDSGCILRPHTAAGTTKAAINAWALEKALSETKGDVPRALQQFDETMRPLALYLSEVGKRIGQQSQFPGGSPKGAAAAPAAAGGVAPSSRPAPAVAPVAAARVGA